MSTRKFETITADLLEVVNDIVPRSTPIGAYLIGLYTIGSLRVSNYKPDRELFEKLATCRNLQSGHMLYAAWKRRKKEEQTANG